MESNNGDEGHEEYVLSLNLALVKGILATPITSLRQVRKE